MKVLLVTGNVGKISNDGTHHLVLSSHFRSTPFDSHSVILIIIYVYLCMHNYTHT